MDSDLHAWLRGKARERGISMNTAIVAALETVRQDAGVASQPTSEQVVEAEAVIRAAQLRGVRPG